MSAKKSCGTVFSFFLKSGNEKNNILQSPHISILMVSQKIIPVTRISGRLRIGVWSHLGQRFGYDVSGLNHSFNVLGRYFWPLRLIIAFPILFVVNKISIVFRIVGIKCIILKKKLYIINQLIYIGVVSMATKIGHISA